MFARISRRYDLLNTVMTAGRHHAWRDIAAGMAADRLMGPALDVATGTGDFALALSCHSSVSTVVGLDYTQEMIALAANKAQRKGMDQRLNFVVGDAHSLPFADGQFICATVGFGMRNFIDSAKALQEIVRVVKPGGRVVVLEIVRIESKSLLSKLVPVYFRYATPWIGALLAGDREAYSYLPGSVEEFLVAREVTCVMKRAGLSNVSYREMALGAVSVHVGEKR